MIAIANLINTVIWLYTLVLIVHVVLSWLTAFNVVNTRHPFVNGLGQITYRLCEPVLSKIRGASCPAWAGSTCRRSC